MKFCFQACCLFVALHVLCFAVEPAWAPHKKSDAEFTGRKWETYQHSTKPEWGYKAPQQDTFFVLHPKEKPSGKAPLYVVLHSAGHDVHSCLKCTATVGNHDIYHAPEGFYALYLDCGANRKTDWWWGIEKFKGSEVSPPEKRVIDTVKWVIREYGLDENRVYLCGNSMGGSGTLGIGLRHGDVFAAIKANVPAGVEHAASRMFFPPQSIPDGIKLPDPPIVIDYSGTNDSWSKGHDQFYKAMNERKYPLYMYWGPFGHANNHANILKVNDLINSFDWLNVKKNEAYAVFTNASSNDLLPWPDQLNEKKPGQVNAFFRWRNVSDTPDAFETSLFLTKPAELQTSFTIPTEATADVSLRRLQSFQIAPNQTVQWSYNSTSGEAKADATGCLTIPQLKITAEPASLKLKSTRN
jgi:poly(3-hydroxybutyrate) depolymerase